MKKVVINKDKCLGCGMCVGSNSKVFNFDNDGLAKANNNEINDKNKDEINDIIDSCPVGAIEVKEESKAQEETC